MFKLTDFLPQINFSHSVIGPLTQNNLKSEIICLKDNKFLNSSKTRNLNQFHDDNDVIREGAKI